jgi:glycosyltransferase involved in cell wall biosynthesis
MRNSGISEKKLSVITNGVNLDFFSRHHAVKHRINHISNGRFIVSYIGTLAYQYGLDNVLDTAKLLNDREDIVFLFIGEGPQKKEIENKIEQLKLVNVILLDGVPLEQVRDYYTQVDVVLIPLRNLPILESTIPVKLLESMAMGIPVIINANGVARDIMEAGRAGLYAEPDNPQKLKEKILYLSESVEIRKLMGKNGREHINMYYDREKLSNDYLILIDSLLNAKNV